jgi:putative ABC transport system permease protein
MPWYRRWRNVFRAERLDRELDDELLYHLAETVDRLRAQGLPEQEARRIAQRRLGNYSIQKERTRDMNIAAWLDATRADVRYGLRQLRLAPGFTTVAVLSLALGIGANTAIFQLVNAIRLKTLPVKNPQELVALDWEKNSARGGSWSSRSANFTYAQWEQIRDLQQAFSDVLAWSAARFNLTSGGEPRFAEGLYVSDNFFPALGVSALLGRTFTTDEDRSSCQAGAVISYAFWQREFGGSAGVLGRTLLLNGYSIPVIGVTPPSFFGVEVGNRYEVAIPLCADRLLADDKKGRLPGRADWWLSLLGRLKPGWTVKSASAHLRVLSPAIMQATVPPEYRPDMAKRFLANKLFVTEAGTGLSGLREQYERPLWLLMATTGLVLLIACANLANLLLARATVREPEIAVRLAVGASRGRVLRQLLAESLLLAVAGAGLGAGLALGLSRALLTFISTTENPVFVSIGWEGRVLGFTVALAVLTCLLFGLLPAWRSTHFSPAAAMRSGGRSVTAGPERFSLRRGLVALQVALSFVLLVSSFLFVRSLHHVLNSDPGFVTGGVLQVGIDFSKAPFPPGQRFDVYRELTERLSRIPGVLSTAQVGFTPVSGNGWNNTVGPDGAPAAESHKNAFFNRAGPGYFRTMGTRLLAGREFDEHDTLSSTKVAIINEEFAKKYFGSANPVGHTFHLEVGAGKPEPVFQIVGLVANTKYYTLQEDFRPIGFFPIAQDERPGPGASFVLRMAGSPGAIISRAKAAIAAMSPSIGIQFRPFSEQLQESLLRERLMAAVSGGFGVLAALLATLGLYGVITYMVARRRKEMGVRMALGADRAHVIRLVLREAVLLLAVGLVTGLVLSWWTGQAAASLLYGVKPRDTASLLGASLLLSVITLTASYVPARRAANGDPSATLRAE